VIINSQKRRNAYTNYKSSNDKNYREKGKREEKEKGREDGSYFTRGRVTCLFRVVEQIYIALSPPVIPLSRCCCRTLDNVRRREIKGAAEGGEGKGKTRGKKENGRKKNEKYRILIYRRPRRDEMSRVMYALPANALLFHRALVFAEDYPRCVAAARARCASFIFGSALRSSRCRVKPACPRQS